MKYIIFLFILIPTFIAAQTAAVKVLAMDQTPALQAELNDPSNLYFVI